MRWPSGAGSSSSSGVALAMLRLRASRLLAEILGAEGSAFVSGMVFCVRADVLGGAGFLTGEGAIFAGVGRCFAGFGDCWVLGAVVALSASGLEMTSDANRIVLVLIVAAAWG